MAVNMLVPEVFRPTSVEDAVRSLTELGDDGVALAGGTWIARAPRRGETPRRAYVSLHGIAMLHEIALGVFPRLGALVTHGQIAEASLPGALNGLARAAATSAFPAIRSVATIGGNLAAAPFPEADLVPALIAADARLLLVDAEGRRSSPVSTYMVDRDSRGPAALIVGIEVPAPAGRHSGFQRLTIRGSGEYAVASVAVSVDLDEAGQVVWARIAIGSVEDRARSSESASAELVGRSLDAGVIARAGAALAADCKPRDGLDAPGWYRASVLPRLLRDALADLHAGGPS